VRKKPSSERRSKFATKMRSLNRPLSTRPVPSETGTAGRACTSIFHVFDAEIFRVLTCTGEFKEETFNVTFFLTWKAMQ